MKKILIIETGGTIMMEKSEKDSYKPSDNPNSILNHIPELKKIAEVRATMLLSKDSANFQIEDWKLISETISKQYENYDGFVIIHGTDTMAYTASALSFSLQNLNKPVILTGSQIPLDEVASDGKNNVINSVRFACHNIAEVCIFFGSRLIRGNKCTKISEFDLKAFEGVNCPYLGKAGLDIILKNNHKSPKTNSLSLKTNFENKVAIIKLFPHININYFSGILDTDIRGIIIEGFGAGNLPHFDDSFDIFIGKCRSKNITVVISTQCVYGTAEYERYIGGMKAKQAGCLTSFDMTKETTLIKLMWVLGQTSDQDTIKELYYENIAQEINHKMLF